MWLLLAFSSAVLLGFYDVFKKQGLKNNAVLPVLTLNTLFCSLVFLPLVIMSATGNIGADSLFYVPATTWTDQKYIFLKAVIVLSSWLCGYYGIKHLPITIVGPINATRPVMVLLGALFFFGERLNLYQWIGVLLAIFGFFLLSRSGKKEGIDFRHNRWILLVVLAAVLGAVSGLYDKYLLAPVGSGGVGINRMAVQCYFTFYQFLMMMVVAVISRRVEASLTSFSWRWSILLISLFLVAADFVYFYALTLPTALISVVSMIRRSSVVVSFAVGALVFREKNLRSKAFDMLLVLLSLLFLWLGSR